MKWIALACGVLFAVSSANAQVLYLLSCNEPCEKCVKTKVPIKMTFKADPKTQLVMRVAEYEDGGRNVSADKCNVVDKKNWVCTVNSLDPESAKSYAVDGIAYQNDVSLQMENLSSDLKQLLGRYSCRYRRTAMGNFEVVKETKKW
jgi:hypothetical protein